MKFFHTPGLLFLACTLVSFVLAAFVAYVAMSQPWIGLSLATDNSRGAVTLHASGPVPEDFIGFALASVQAEGQNPITVTSDTLIEEPDMIATFEGLRRFYTNQGAIFRALLTGEVTLAFRAPGAADTTIPVVVEVQQARPLSSLPLKFWTQLGVGVVGLVIGFWLVSLRIRDLAAWMVLLTGVGLALAAWTASVYSTREIALDYATFKIASHINGVGTLVFGIGMLTLFLIYPRRIVPRLLVLLPTLAIGSMIIFIQVYDWPRHVGLLQDAVAATMLALLIAIAVQVFVNRHTPTARAMLGWLGVAVSVGAGGFVVTAILPTMLGQSVWLAQSTAFLFFLIIYVGIALGVARYRLFDLPIWSFRMLFYGVGVVLLLLLDAALIFGLSVDRAPALGMSLAIIGAVYLPLRERAGAWLSRDRTMPPEVIYRRITEISHAMDPQKKQEERLNFWQDVFDPLSIDTVTSEAPGDCRLEQDGAALALAPVFGLPPLRLSWARKGTRLFSSRDLQRARTLSAFMDTSLRQNQTYLDAIASERRRINRDMHDNIGVLLIGALRSDSQERKNDLIRQTLFDLREIVSNPNQDAHPLGHIVADLRAQVSRHLEDAGIAAEWQAGPFPHVELNTALVQTLRALMLEGTNNVIRHSGATQVMFRITYDAPDLSVMIIDDGSGFSTEAARPGSGLKNLAERVSQVSGTFDLERTTTGSVLSARLPLVPTEASAER
ncbi:ATPase [Sagittula sp. NFXS13]|uniref:sensor histidine kinase n=1 Tax=Sagittula sp. NFXS13 TaxID=2819095 RepID=UPI0032E02712